eukprot:CAMPEP_0201551836 /NCGR_PEP_ID=MMETSP0173_2-20130828/10814_1 /ASSEMBLY_ACC=CAM_ASM_000268 /TAXON_ID=218659 /ORGANISM="Vexillifera sp., Strain DIVA3 564/2" /LENGTH=128 /DNA_ID=CAMNT_0047962185 /DNA_START=194 /DNA_END=576 /DNA_ORIENTATION=+
MRSHAKEKADLKDHQNEHAHVHAEDRHLIKIFRAQRNIYMSGFTLFLYLLLWRFQSMLKEISESQEKIGKLQTNLDVLKKQATNNANASEHVDSKQVKQLESQVKDLQNEIDQLRKETDASSSNKKET